MIGLAIPPQHRQQDRQWTPTRRTAQAGLAATPPASETPDPSRSINYAGLIVRIAADHDRKAFRDLFAAFAPRVKSYLLRHGATSAQAEDLAQEALLAVWRKASYYDPGRAGAAAWIFTIARNLRIDAMRHERSALVYDIEPPEQTDSAPGADDQMVASQRDALLRDAMRVLPGEQVEVIRMSFFQDKPHSQIAADLSLPLGTVKSRVRLALARLRAALDEAP